MDPKGAGPGEEQSVKLDDGETVDMALSMTKISFPGKGLGSGPEKPGKSESHKK